MGQVEREVDVEWRNGGRSATSILCSGTRHCKLSLVVFL